MLELPANVGKARVIRRALDHPWAKLSGDRLVEAYSHILVVDDDVVLGGDYLPKMRQCLSDPSIAIAEGWSDSYWPASHRWNPWIAARVVTWRLQIITIPLQAAVGTRAWLTGSHAAYRSDVLDQISRDEPVFAIEDCDFLWRVQRERLGRVVFVRRARALWQQASSWSDLHAQHLRWYTGSWQAMLYHGVGRQRSRHDAWFVLWVTELMFHTVWPVLLVVLCVAGVLSPVPALLAVVAFYVLTATAAAVATRRPQLFVLWPAALGYDLLWRYFSFRGLARGWKHPTSEAGAWASPKRAEP